MRFRHLVVPAAFMFALTGCGGADKYDTPADIATALNDNGVACANFENTDRAVSAAGRGSCYLGDKQLMLSIYASEADAKAERHSKLLGGLDSIMVVGPNWTVSCTLEADCEKVKDAIGGDLVKVPKP